MNLIIIINIIIIIIIPVYILVGKQVQYHLNCSSNLTLLMLLSLIGTILTSIDFQKLGPIKFPD